MSIRNPRIFRSFVALADTQSFTEAAKRMGMTTSAASQALKALEEELAVALISRKSRPVMLTGAGRNLLDGARALLPGCSRVGNGGYGIFANPPAFAAWAG